MRRVDELTSNRSIRPVFDPEQLGPERTAEGRSWPRAAERFVKGREHSRTMTLFLEMSKSNEK
ncbi:MAG: hypothetical protein PVI20_01825 [Desulfobacteraceae bacterium]